MLWQSKILKQERDRDREESIEVEREVGDIDRQKDRQMEGEKVES